MGVWLGGCICLLVMTQTAHAQQCHGSRQGGYERHRPEQTALYQTVSAYWQKFLERAEQAGGLPNFVKREIEAYLDCGLIEKGYVLLECPSCGLQRAVAFSCKKRGGICPSCMGRRMNDTAAHLVDRVLPLNTPVRQWVCSMPLDRTTQCTRFESYHPLPLASLVWPVVARYATAHNRRRLVHRVPAT